MKVSSRKGHPDYQRATWPRERAARRAISPSSTITTATGFMISSRKWTPTTRRRRHI